MSASIELDWASEQLEAEGLKVELVSEAGPSGWPVARVSGEREALLAWLRGVYRLDEELVEKLVR